ncbi:MAG: amidohydrolase [Solobacterium sp.]|nr:amidohydrolase [Solobacterium sp.]MBR3127750.1 amidohydrolase [Solobacterium sp.]
MNERQEQLIRNVDKNKQLILDAEQYIWKHPQTGYTEWDAHNYLVEKYEALGYKLVLAGKIPGFGDIPGFYTDVDTGRPGPTLAIFGELDALDIANHPESVNGMTHCCGHHAQSAVLLGLAAAFKEPGALDGLCGKIRLIAVPAEEMIQLTFREELRKKGVINYMGGKVEFMYRGILDDVDLAIMVHGTSAGEGEPYDFICGFGNNGCMPKTIKFKGKSAHAGAAPHMGINAQYAAMLGLQAVNDLRETFQEKDTIRFHPIMLGVNCAVNIIPDEFRIESYVRGKTNEAIKRENIKVNRALTGAALAMGAGVELVDRPGYSPETHDPDFMKLVQKCCEDLVGADRVHFDYNQWSTGSSDFGDITCVMPGIQFNAAGITGTLHGIDFHVADTDRLLMNSAKAQLFVTDALLGNDAAAAKEIIANYKPQYASIKEYFAAIDDFILDKDAVVYDEDGNATVDFKNA